MAINVHQRVLVVQTHARVRVRDVLVNVPMRVHRDVMDALQHASDSVREHVEKVALVNVLHAVVRVIHYVDPVRVHVRQHVCLCVPMAAMTNVWIPVAARAWKNVQLHVWIHVRHNVLDVHPHVIAHVLSYAQQVALLLLPAVQQLLKKYRP